MPALRAHLTFAKVCVIPTESLPPQRRGACPRKGGGEESIWVQDPMVDSRLHGNDRPANWQSEKFTIRDALGLALQNDFRPKQELNTDYLSGAEKT